MRMTSALFVIDAIDARSVLLVKPRGLHRATGPPRRLPAILRWGPTGLT